MLPLGLLLALSTLLSASGCATVVLGPGESPVLLPALLGALRSQLPQGGGHGPELGCSSTYQETFAASVRASLDSIRLAPVAGRSVYVQGWEPEHRGGPAKPDAPRHAPPASVVNRYLAQQVALKLLRAGARVVPRAEGAELQLFPWAEVAGGTTTERVYRLYGYPLYYHYEDHRLSRLSLLLYDPARGRVVDLARSKRSRLTLDSYFLDVIGVRFDF